MDTSAQTRRDADTTRCTFAQLRDVRFDDAFAGCWWSHVPLERLGNRARVVRWMAFEHYWVLEYTLV